MASDDKVYERIRLNAAQLMETYPTAARLLEDAMKEAMPWAMALAMQKRLPSLVQLERLATQLIAIVAASQVDSPPVAAVKYAQMRCS